jgi:hypothetical protein
LLALRQHPAHIGLKKLYKQKALDKEELYLLAKVCVDDITYKERNVKHHYHQGIRQKLFHNSEDLNCACQKLDFVNYF